jgi:uncharacterized repeat protein (TIGR01451 family)
MVETDGSVTWTLAVTNNGPGTSSGYVVTDDVPAGYRSVASTTPGCTASGRTVTCIGGTLRDSASTTINITATAPTTVGCLTNTATVEANEPDPTVTNNSSQYETCVAAPFAAIAIVKHGTVAPVADQNGALLDDVISYTYAVTNTGNEPLNAVAVSDPTLGAVSCPQPTLAPGDSELCVAQADHTVTAADVGAGRVSDTATASGTAASGLVTSDPSTVVIPTLAPTSPATPTVPTPTKVTTPVPTNPVAASTPTPAASPQPASTPTPAPTTPTAAAKSTLAPSPTPTSVSVGVTG